MAAETSRPRRLRAPAPVRRVVAGVTAGYGALRRGLRALVSGDRPYLALMVGLLALGALMLSSPARSFLDGRSRVELLELKLAALQQENVALAERTRELRDLDQIELLAREQLGLIQPGEVPYAVVPPEIDRPRIAPPREPPAPPSPPWYRRLWRAVFG